MYLDRQEKHTGRKIGLIFAALVLVAVAVFFVQKGSSNKLSTESIEAIRDAVQRSALQCYVVEGTYPPNLAYLEDNYGLTVNQEDFVVEYRAFSSNLPPSVTVVPSNQ